MNLFVWITHVFLLASSVQGFPYQEGLFERELLQLVDNGKQSPYLKSLAEEYELHKLLTEDFSTSEWSDEKVEGFCAACTNTVRIGLHSNDADFVIGAAINICLQFNLGNDVVCDGMVNKNAPIFIYMKKNYRDQLDPKDMCGFVFSECNTTNPDRIWEVTMPDVQKPPIVEEPPYPEISSVPTFQILHLSDTHIDMKYSVGSNAVCEEEYFCCREENGIPSDPADGAGQWGDYRACDLPVWTLEVIYQHIADNFPNLDMIFWTGDVIPHIDWETDKNSTIDTIRQMSDLLSQYFPGIPVYSALGNHDTDEVNQFSQPYITDPEFNMAWLYEPLADIWGRWLPSFVTTDVAASGSFNMLIKPGLRLISLNTNFCQDINWWLLIDSNDGGSELYNLAQILQAAEFAGENVYIISHFAPGSCFGVFSHQYFSIIARYEATITGMFFGHTHHDQPKLFSDPDNSSRIFDVAYIGQSQTTYTNINPGYKVYTVEGEFTNSKFRVLDHVNYYFPMDVANADNKTDLPFLYSALEDYQMTDLSPQSWDQLMHTMNEPNSPIFDDFQRNYQKNGPQAGNCDDGCKHSLLCSCYSDDGESHDGCRLEYTTSN